ncbi:MAG TPA: hypothetical protein VEV17_02875 [Bryobacteraceae bacterium]|nr:hypothetical protein [Bryobacteraceae bacterium]
MTRFFILALGLTLAAAMDAAAGSITAVPRIEAGYRQMYDLEFDQAHQTFADWERQHPDDPLGPVSNAAAYLFAEFDRLKVLQSEFFVEDRLFRRRPRLNADPEVRGKFNAELSKSEQLAKDILSKSPSDANTLFAKILTLGLRADYLSLIEKRNMDALKIVKEGRETADQLLAIEPSYYDAYLAIGVENYLLSLKPAPVRWILQIGGAEVDRERGIRDLSLTAEKGHYLSPYARLLLAVAALRNKDRQRAHDILAELAHEFPHNRLYTEELARLQ